MARCIDFSHHRKLKEIIELRDDAWAHVHISCRTLSFGNHTYNLKTQLSKSIVVPQTYFGEEYKAVDNEYVSQVINEVDSDSDDDEE